MTYAVTKFEVARSNGLGDTFTRNATDPHTDVRAMDRLWYKINITLFSKEKSSITSVLFLNSNNSMTGLFCSTTVKKYFSKILGLKLTILLSSQTISN